MGVGPVCRRVNGYVQACTCNSGYEMWQKDWSERWRQPPKVQFSGAFQCEIPLFDNTFFIVTAICWDRGQVLGNRIGANLGLRYNFIRNFERKYA